MAMMQGRPANDGAADYSGVASNPAGYAGQMSLRRRRSPQLFLAGWLTVVAGLLAFFNGLTAFLGESSSDWFAVDIVVNRYTVCGIIIMAFGVVAVVGGLSAVLGRNVSLALAGAALGTIGDGLPGFLLGLTAVALLFLSNEDL